ncbi:hypothetical protein Ancab_028624 [Ancistrocladus abbreviatus]
MGGSTASCLKIIACGSNATDHDDIEAPEAKASSDRRGWSFRKRSARHRVLSNSVISETTTSGNKEIPQTVSVNFQTPAIPTVPEKVTTQKEVLDEIPQLPSFDDSKASETPVAVQNGSNVSLAADENVALVIQTAARGFLAQRRLVQLKSIIKLQAAIRGYMVRIQAVETLYCIQGIAKVQALVRARHAKLLDNKTSGTQSATAQSYVEKLLRNGFARQLLESTPKPRSMKIKCDPSIPNSGWRWLERWMSISSSELAEFQKEESSELVELQKQDFNAEQEEQKQVEDIPHQIEAGIPPVLHSELANLEPEVVESVELVENVNNSINSDADRNIEAAEEQAPSGKSDASHDEVMPEEINVFADQNIQSGSHSDFQSSSYPDKPAVDGEQPKRSAKRMASDQLDTEGKKFVYGSRKASNPSFIAAQSKFVELSSVANSGRSFSVSQQDTGVESYVDTVSSGIESVVKTREPSAVELQDQRIHVGGSDCGTELSVTSTLDSPDRSEVAVRDVEHEIKSMEERAQDLNSIKSSDVKGNGMPSISVSDLSSSAQQEEFPEINGYSGDPVVIVDSPQLEHEAENSESHVHVNTNLELTPVEQQLERNETDLQVGLVSQTEQTYKSSPEASPKSHATVVESQGTPSSQISLKVKRSKINKSGSTPKGSSLPAGKRSPSNANHDSGGRSSVEQLAKDQKNGKRRKSFGATKSDHVDQEPRDSSSSNSLPSYMQATESARAKAHSPRSSPDVQPKEVYTKKRHSLPGATGRQESPRIQRSMSQAPQVAKGNDTHERRWQR